MRFWHSKKPLQIFAAPEERNITRTNTKRISAPEERNVTRKNTKHTQAPEERNITRKNTKHISAPEERHITLDHILAKDNLFQTKDFYIYIV